MPKVAIWPNRLTLKTPSNGVATSVPKSGTVVSSILRASSSLRATQPSVLFDRPPAGEAERRLAGEGEGAMNTVNAYLAPYREFLSTHPITDKLATQVVLTQVEQRRQTTRLQILTICCTPELLEHDYLFEATAEPLLPLEFRVKRRLDAHRITLAACLTELSQAEAANIASKEIASKIRQTHGIQVPAIANPSAKFQTIAINDPVLTKPHTLRGSLGETDEYLAIYFRKAAEYWEKIEASGLHMEDDINFLIAASVLPRPGDTLQLVLPKFATATEMVQNQSRAWDLTKQLIDENQKVLRATVELVCSLEVVRDLDSCTECKGGINPATGRTCRACHGTSRTFTPDSWPPDVRVLPIDEKSAWIAQQLIAQLALPADRLEAYRLTYRQILPIVKSCFEITFDQPKFGTAKNGWEVNYTPLVAKSTATVLGVVEIIYQQCLSSLFSFRSHVFGGVTFKFGEPFLGAGPYDPIGGYTILEKMYTAPHRYDDLYSELIRWRGNTSSSLSMQARSISSRGSELASGIVRDAEAFKTAYDAARTARDVRAALLEIADRMGAAEGKYFDAGELLLPADSKVVQTYVDEGTVMHADEAILTCEDLFTRNVTIILKQDEFDSYPISRESLFRLEPEDPSEWSVDLVLACVADTVEMDFDAWRVEARLIPCVSTITIGIEGAGVPTLIPISNRLADAFEGLKPVRDRAMSIPKSGLHSFKLYDLRA